MSVKRFLQHRWLLVGGILLFVIALTACGGGGTGEAPTAEEPTEAPVAVAPTEAPAPEPTEKPAPEPTEEPAAEPTEETAVVVELTGDPISGGLLYDKWWETLRMDAPEGDHPLWATQDSNQRTGKDTWRCKECHGWDYKGADGAYGSGSHFTGFTGIFHLAGADPNEILAALKGETNPDHDFSPVMDEQALIDLALFISEDMLDSTAVIGDDKAALSADVAAGETLYQDTCTECHGPEGLAINFGKLASDAEYVGVIAIGNPYEFIHKVRFGQPDSPMPAALDEGWTVEDQAAVLAYAQTLPEESLTTQGGQLYDKWWAAAGVDAPESDQPLWAAQDSNERTGADTWRCKECHGWDYRGVDGAYGSGSHFTGFPGIWEASSLSADELTAWLNGEANADHDFSAYLDESTIDMLVAFIQNGLVDMSQYVNEDKTVSGDPDHGKSLYSQGCTRCHGSDGQKINFGSEDDPEYLPDLAAGNPWEGLHKAANGQPAEDMVSGLNLGWTWQDLADVIAYLQTLNE